MIELFSNFGFSLFAFSLMPSLLAFVVLYSFTKYPNDYKVELPNGRNFLEFWIQSFIIWSYAELPKGRTNQMVELGSNYADSESIDIKMTKLTKWSNFS